MIEINIKAKKPESRRSAYVSYNTVGNYKYVTINWEVEQKKWETEMKALEEAFNQQKYKSV